MFFKLRHLSVDGDLIEKRLAVHCRELQGASLVTLASECLLLIHRKPEPRDILEATNEPRKQEPEFREPVAGFGSAADSA
ncbi:MAG: hypothetical protein WA476_14365, partial [Acidobacteriaceae bacterium]